MHPPAARRDGRFRPGGLETKQGQMSGSICEHGVEAGLRKEAKAGEQNRKSRRAESVAA
jgi:hypothetical protein